MVGTRRGRRVAHRWGSRTPPSRRMRALLLWAWLAAGSDARRLAAKKKKVKKKRGVKKPQCVDAVCRTEHDGAYYHKIKCLAELAPVVRDAR